MLVSTTKLLPQFQCPHLGILKKENENMKDKIKEIIKKQKN